MLPELEKEINPYRLLFNTLVFCVIVVSRLNYYFNVIVEVLNNE